MKSLTRLVREKSKRYLDQGSEATWRELRTRARSGTRRCTPTALATVSRNMAIPVPKSPMKQAQEYTKGHPISGWFAMVIAAIAATEENKNECEAAIAQATEVVHGLPHTSEWADMYYTDFNVVGVDAFAGNCLIKVGEPEKGLERLAAIDMGILSDNRHASAFYDIACAHAMLGEFEVTQAHAFRAIDKALVTDRLYIIPRLITLARRMQKKDPQEPHAAAIVDYAHAALHEYSKGELE